MKILSYADVDFAALGVGAGIPSDFPGWDVQTQELARPGAPPAMADNRLGARPIPVVFTVKSGSIETTFSALRRSLAPLDPSPRRMVAQRGDGSLVEIMARVGPWAKLNTNQLQVTFSAADLVWSRQVARSATKSFSRNDDHSLAVSVGGDVAVAPIIRIQPTGQRTGSTSATGWKYRRRLTITNNATGGLNRYPVRINIGNTATLVTAGKARSDGYDLRVWYNGQDIGRRLINWNTASTWLWVTIPRLATGKTATIAIVYGNANADPSPNPAGTADNPIFDLDNSTNAQWAYNVIETLAPGGGNRGIGGWYLSSTDRWPARVSFDSPGGWQRVLTLDNPDNRDDLNQERWNTFTVTGSTYYHGRFMARRLRADAANLSDEGLADGVMLSNPLGIISVYADLRLYNNSGPTGTTTDPGIGKVVILARESGAETWQKLYENTSVQVPEVTIAAATYATAYPYAKQIAFAVWPYGDTEIPPETPDWKRIYASWWTALTVNLDSSKLVLSGLGAETAIYEVGTILTLGSPATAPYHRLYVGGASDRRLATELNQVLVLDCARRSLQVWDSGLTAKVEDAPISSIAAFQVDPVDGGTVAYVPRDWLPLKPTSLQLITNPDFGTDLTGWSVVNTAAGVGVSWSVDTVTYEVGPGAARAIISTSTAPIGIATSILSGTKLPVGPGDAHHVAAAVRTNATGVRPRLGINWYRANGTFLTGAMESSWGPTPDIWYRRVFQAIAPAEAATAQVVMIVYGEAAGGTGTVRFDSVSWDENELIVEDPAPGTVQVTAVWTEGVL